MGGIYQPALLAFPLPMRISINSFADQRLPASFGGSSRRLFAVVLIGGLAMVAHAQDELLATFRSDLEPVLDLYCMDCHGYGSSKGGVVLDEWASDEELRDHELWMRVLKNVRGGIMPPPDEIQLEEAEREAIVHWIKAKAFELDAADPDPGRVTVRRLNRVEYSNTIKDLIGVEYDTAAEFPADDTGHGFDNIADVLTISPMLLEKYLDAAQAIVDEAVPTNSRQVAQLRLPGKDFKSVVTVAPELGIEAEDDASAIAPPAPTKEGWQAGEIRGSELDLLYYAPAGVGLTHQVAIEGDYEVELNFRAVERYVDNEFDLNKCLLVFKIDGVPVLAKEMVREGWRDFTYTFPQKLVAGAHEFLVEIKPMEPFVEQKRDLRVRLTNVTLHGPMAAEYWVPPPNYADYFPRPVPEDSAGRRAYAAELLQGFADRAFRRPVDPYTIDRLVNVVESVAELPDSSFETGVAQAMVAVLASPRFLFREEEAEPLREGERFPLVDEYALASRLSYFFWSTMPDEALFDLAKSGTLRDNLSTQVKRMMDHPKSAQFVENFTGQWLQARDVEEVQISDLSVFLREHPNAAVSDAQAAFRRISGIREADRTPEQLVELAEARRVYSDFVRLPRPKFEGGLREAMRRETELYFDYIIREDRDLLELLDSNYTFLNEELAQHYDIDHEEILGEEMRKVILPPGSPRGGVLTQGTVLAVTSNPTRTSPVKRGVFILDHILGTPPPPPPPNIPSLEDAADPDELLKLSLRENLALHASDPLCSSCHMRMDPLGLALENFNAMGQWRDAEMGKPIEPEGKLISGESFATIQELKTILATNHREQFLHTLAEKMLIYALGRGMEYYDTETLDQLVTSLGANGARPSNLIHGIVESAAFQRTRVRAASLSSNNSLNPTEDTGEQIVQVHPQL